MQLPGRENRFAERPYGSMSDLIPSLVEALETRLDLPYAFYGHSLGATIAFEAARALRRRGRPQPVHLFAAASPAPQVPWPYPRMGLLGESQFLAEVQRRYGGIPRPVIEDAQLRALLVPTLRADMNLLETYTYEAEHPLECRITVLGGDADRIVTREILEPWREQTLNGCTLHLLEGDHFFLQSERARLLALISEELSRNYASRTPHRISPS